MAYRSHIYQQTWQPILNVSDVAILLRSTDDLVLRVTHIEMKPATVIDFGSCAAGVTIPAQAAVNASGQDVNQTGPDQFTQTRLRLDPRDFLTNPASGNPAYLQAYQPGPSLTRWALPYQVYAWDPITQSYWTSLNPTELFTWYTDSPQFSITNPAGNATMNNTRVWFYQVTYTGEPIGQDPNGDTARSFIEKSNYGKPIYVPVAVKQARTRMNTYQ